MATSTSKSNLLSDHVTQHHPISQVQRPSDDSPSYPGKHLEHCGTRYGSPSIQHSQQRTGNHFQLHPLPSRAATEGSSNAHKTLGSCSQVSTSCERPLGQAALELPSGTSSSRNWSISQRNLVEPVDLTLNDNSIRATAVEDGRFLKYINTLLAFATGPKKARDSIPVFSLTEASTEPLGQFQEDIGSQQQEDYEPVPIERLRECDVLIALMGPTGAGKSSFIGKVIDRDDIGVGHDLQSFTTEVRALRVRIPEMGENIILVDTPGFDDTHKSDYEILELIAKWLKTTGVRNIRLHGVLYLHRITDNRMAGTPLRNLELFQKICGPRWFSRVLLVTTKWDEVESTETGELREQELRSDFWKAMIDRGSQTIRHYNDRDSAWRILKLILEVSEVSGLPTLREEKTSPQKQVIKLQKETADKGKTLPKTDVGYQLYSQMNELERKRKGFIEKLDKQMAGANVDQDYRRILQDQRNQLQQESDIAAGDIGSLKLPIAQRFMKSFKAKWSG